MWPVRNSTVTGSPLLRGISALTRTGISAGVALTAIVLSAAASFTFHHRRRWGTIPRCFANRSTVSPLRRHASRAPRASTFDH